MGNDISRMAAQAHSNNGVKTKINIESSYAEEYKVKPNISTYDK